MSKGSRVVVLGVSLAVLLLSWSQLASSLPQVNLKQTKSGALHVDKPASFDSAEADRILAALQVFPPDNPWNEDVSQRALASNSAAIIASIGADKPLDFNLDMNFVLVPPNQPRVPVKITEYPGESDPGPFPVPDIMPIENWPLHRNEDSGAIPGPGSTLDDIQRHGTGSTTMPWIRSMECYMSSTRLERQARAGRRHRLLCLI